MEFEIFSFRNAKTIFENDAKFCDLWDEIKYVLEDITDQDIINTFNTKKKKIQKVFLMLLIG